MVKKEIEDRLSTGIYDMPEFLKNMPNKGDKGRAIAMLAAQLKNLKPGKCRIYTATEFAEEFKTKVGMKQEMAYVKSQLLKSHGIKRSNSFVDAKDGRIYFWQNKV